MPYWNDGAQGRIWEPLYRIETTLTPCEQAVLQNPAMRRLQRIAHYGAAARILPITHSRYIHTLGVFTLTAHFCPTDYPLRLAALLHDVGHLPFSHSAERALGLDHHALTRQVLAQSGLDETLRQHGFAPAEVDARIDGRPPNPLVCGKGGMSLDHIDSWLRDTEAVGAGKIPPHALLPRLRLNGPYLEATDEEAALEVIERVVLDQHLFLDPRALALDALVIGIFEAAHPAVEPLLALGDEETLSLAAATVPDLVSLLRDRPWAVQVRLDDAGDGALVQVSKRYAGQIHLGGCPVSESLPEAAELLSSLERLVQRYRVTW